ncbi:MAG: signal recognition particle protein [Deltaproteobacteria bacterium]|jgi:signal recognition particle subunit SRP54|nr:signal recognition particle protein [Deltaproteobacteria bacterium]
MFERLTDKLSQVFEKITGHGKLTEKDINLALKEVRLALLEADVNYKVVKDFLIAVGQRATGQEILKSLTPAQQVIKVVYDELTQLMGGTHVGLNLTGPPPRVVMLVGLQGSGKTTTAAKLAAYVKKQNHVPYLVPADVARPAAIDQLTRLAEEIACPVYPSTTGQRPAEIAAKSLVAAGSVGSDVIIIDTAGRLTIDQALMTELIEIKKVTSCQEILLVADGMTGQEAVRVAHDFDQALNLSGAILTKMEGDARGGAAMSILAVTKKPLKFMGLGEKISAFEPFHPERVASVILGMGDVLSLIEKAQEVVDQEESARLLSVLSKGEFTLDDFKKQMIQLKKIGTVESILSMIPGLGRLKKFQEAIPDPKEMVQIEAIIDSMTTKERFRPQIIDASRRRRIAQGSGTTTQDVNLLIRNFGLAKKFMAQAGGKRGDLIQNLTSMLKRI